MPPLYWIDSQGVMREAPDTPNMRRVLAVVAESQVRQQRRLRRNLLLQLVCVGMVLVAVVLAIVVTR